MHVSRFSLKSLASAAARIIALVLLASPLIAFAQTDLTVALGVQSFEGLDPHMQASPPTNSIVKAIYDTLVYADENNNIQPMLATSWEAVDDLTWVFHLRPGVLFHDGSPLDARAVVMTFDRVLDPDAGLTRRSQFEMVKSVEALDESTVQFNLSHPSGILLNELAYAGGGIISPAAIEEYGKDIALHPVGAGPFKLREMVGGDHITLERFDDYWGGPNALSQVTFIPVTEDATRALMLESGEADIIANVPPSLVSRLQNSPSLQVVTATTSRVIHLGMNVEHAPFDNVLVRKALNYAVDKDAIIDTVLQGLGSPTNSYIAPTTWGYFDTGGYPYDPEEARALLSEAGYPDGFEATLLVPAGRYFAGQQVAEAVQGYLSRVGVSVKLESMEWGAFTQRILTPLDEGNDTQMYLLGWEASTGEPSVVSLWALGSSMWPPNGWNAMFYKNDLFDELVAQAGVTTDAEKRLDLFRQTQELVVEDAPWVFLYAAKSVWGARADISDIVILPDETLILKDVRIGKN